MDDAVDDDAAVEDKAAVAEAALVTAAAPAEPVDTGAPAAVEPPPDTAALVAGVAAGVTAAPVGAPAVDPVVAGAALLPPSALEFDVQAAVASRLNDSNATVARRLQRVGWTAVRMLILEICAV